MALLRMVQIYQYARVSKLNMSPANQELNQHFKKRLKAPSVDDESCAPLQMGELLSAIKKMKRKGAVGPDNIPPSFLRSPGPLTLKELLSMLNSSFSLAHCPHIWRVADLDKSHSCLHDIQIIDFTNRKFFNKYNH